MQILWSYHMYIQCDRKYIKFPQFSVVFFFLFTTICLTDGIKGFYWVPTTYIVTQKDGKLSLHEKRTISNAYQIPRTVKVNKEN